MIIIQLALGVAAIFLAVLIAWRQHIQLRQLKRIGEETANTAKKLKTDTYTQQIVTTFFFLGQESSNKYKCVFPVYYAQRPLPLIVAGDYNVLHILQNLMGSKRLELIAIPQDPQCLDLKQSLDNHDVPKWLEKDNIIFLCMPPINPILHLIAPAISINDPNSNNVQIPKLRNIILPCWFTIDKSGKLPTEPPTKKIWIPDLRIELQSGAEKDYEKAANLDLWKAYDPVKIIQTDYGILMRLSEGKRKVIVIAGIHQYGTWIVGEFFRMITLGAQVSGRKIFESREDFLAVIWGEFDSRQFSVQRCGVLQDYLWVRRDDHWDRVKTSEEDTATSSLLSPPDGARCSPQPSPSSPTPPSDSQNMP